VGTILAAGPQGRVAGCVAHVVSAPLDRAALGECLRPVTPELAVAGIYITLDSYKLEFKVGLSIDVFGRVSRQRAVSVPLGDHLRKLAGRVDDGWLLGWTADKAAGRAHRGVLEMIEYALSVVVGFPHLRGVAIIGSLAIPRVKKPLAKYTDALLALFARGGEFVVKAGETLADVRRRISALVAKNNQDPASVEARDAQARAGVTVEDMAGRVVATSVVHNPGALDARVDTEVDRLLDGGLAVGTDADLKNLAGVVCAAIQGDAEADEFVERSCLLPSHVFDRVAIRVCARAAPGDPEPDYFWAQLEQAVDDTTGDAKKSTASTLALFYGGG
jgi:hypothetical protein